MTRLAPVLLEGVGGVLGGPWRLLGGSFVQSESLALVLGGVRGEAPLPGRAGRRARLGTLLPKYMVPGAEYPRSVSRCTAQHWAVGQAGGARQAEGRGPKHTPNLENSFMLSSRSLRKATAVS